MTVQDVRAFNRFSTRAVGALDCGRRPGSPYTLTECRVLYELAHAADTDEHGLCAGLGLGSGHLGRVLGTFEEAGLVERGPSGTRVVLTARGWAAAQLLDERAGKAVGALLGAVDPGERSRLAEAMQTIRAILGDTDPHGPADVVLRAPRPGDLGWIVQRDAVLYAAEHGWNADYEGLVARIVADFAQDHDPRLERVWIAELDGRPVGCVMCVRDDAPGTARLRLLLVDPEARGLGIGDGWSGRWWTSRAGPATGTWCCGRTTCSAPPAASTSGTASRSPPRDRTAPSART